MSRPIRYTDATLQSIALTVYDTTGTWPTVRQLKAACGIGTEYARKALASAQDRRTRTDIDKNPYFAALARALGMDPTEAREHLEQLDRRNISPAKGNTHVSRSDLVMVLALQQPGLDTSDPKIWTKKKLLDHIQNPAAKKFTEALQRRAQTGLDEEGYEQQQTTDAQQVAEISQQLINDIKNRSNNAND